MTTTTLARTSDRALATIETIESLHPISGADAILRARVRGWDTVVKLGEFQPGDRVIYFEVDSHLDTSQERFAFLAPMGQSTNEDGFAGHVVKTVRMRGQYSQGFALPVNQFPEVEGYEVGDDVTDALGIIKWDPSLPDELAATARGFLPSFISESKELRIQNDASILGPTGVDDWVATEKIDGESMTIWVGADGDSGVAGRTIDFLESSGNAKWKLAASTGLLAALRTLTPAGSTAAVQGEHYGPGAAKNRLGLAEARVAVFAYYVNGHEVSRAEWPALLLDHAAPVHDLPFPSTVDEALEQVDALKSLVNPERPAEGIVWRSLTRSTVTLDDGRVIRASAKVISNRYLTRL